MQGLSFSLLGVKYMPDQLLAAAGSGLFPQPEWAARMPVFAMTLISGYISYKAVASLLGRAVGLVSGIALLSMPYWYLLAHQTMTDMPYVAPLTAGMALILLGFHTDPERLARCYAITWKSRSLRFSAHHLLLGSIVLLVLPQILYLAARNVTFHVEPLGLGLPHGDSFFSGSGGGNCGLPGNEVCRRTAPVHGNLQPIYTALGCLVALGALLWSNRNERRLARLYFLLGWLCVALSAMAKGAPGLVLPLFVMGVYVFATKRWQTLPRAAFGSAFLIGACVILPWYVQMYARHGSPFLDRLLMHDMYKRAFLHVHDTNTGDDTSFRYYVWQLGYGLFPWTGISAAGLLWWLRGRAAPPTGDDGSAPDTENDVLTFFGMWFIGAFAMFTISLTKFHHYVFPAVPPLAVVCGVLLCRVYRREHVPAGRQLAAYLAAMAGGVAFITAGLAVALPGSGFGNTVAEKAPGPNLLVGLPLFALGCALFAVAWWTVRRSTAPAAEADGATRLTTLYVGLLGTASAVVVALSGRDMFSTARGDVEGQARLMHLFTYNYGRPWPESLDFNGALMAFTFVAAACCAAFAVRRIETHAVVAMCAVAVWWTVWGVNVYLVKASPHWGQRETVLAYYAHRRGPEEPFVAYQMNWKGENFYTGNRLPAFVSSGAKFKEWLEEQKNKGVRVMYFTTEHSRLNPLKTELGKVASFTVVTTKQLNNKFFVARVAF
jgi:4-amino-4-deoxy-L-arabinose transferase-like glycosyltransferase